MLVVVVIAKPATVIATMIKLFPHQEEAIEKLKTGSILCGGVGSGKSIAALGYYFLKECEGGIKDDDFIPPKKTINLYIITTARKRDSLEWHKECSNFYPHFEPIAIDSWNNIGKYKEVKDSFFIFDEQRLVGSGSWVKSFLKIAEHNHWILLSATPGDTWMDYIPVFIANGFYKNRTAFIREHVVFSRAVKYPKVERYLGEKHLYALREQILVQMPFEKKTERHSYLKQVPYDRLKMSIVRKSRWNPFKNEPIRDAADLCFTSRRVSNENENRLYAIREAVRLHHRVIVFYNFNYELELLRTITDIPFAEYNGHKHQDIPKTERWIYAVQYTAGAEGWECTSTNVVIFFSLHYSYKIMEQAAGRIDRLNTPFIDLYYYLIVTDSWIDNMILDCLKNKRNFEESRVEFDKIA